MKSKASEDLVDLYQKFSQTFDDYSLKSTLRQNILKTYNEIKEPNPKQNYVMGLFFYEDYNENTSKDILKEQTRKAISFFEKSISADENYYMSNLYLGHCYQDLQQYKKAIYYYLKVDQNKLQEEFPLWRFVLLFELVGFCYWKIGKEDIGIKYFKKTHSEYLLLDDYLDLYPIGDYIEDCLGENHSLFIEMKAYEKIKLNQ
ncbi:tetratricopeptide repeat protein [Kordia sp.]|uniref:tetratricopeptide repeat protein n=1 Tax=Kordia sp. TaxID=1965332 RepID=UPI003D6A1F94